MGKDLNLAVVDKITASDMLLKYSLHEARIVALHWQAVAVDTGSFEAKLSGARLD